MAYYFLLALGCSWGCRAQQPPELNNPSKTQYLQQRMALMALDDSLEHSRNIVLNAEEQLLNGKLTELRGQMIQTYKDQHFFPPSRYFFQSKQHMESTSLFKILKLMPKGGILHLHGAASGDARWVVDQVIITPNAYVYWSSSNSTYIKGQLNFFRPQEQPSGFFPASQLAEEVPNFADSLHSLITFNDYIDEDSVDIWAEFEKVFQRIYGFVRYQPVFKKYFYQAFSDLVADGVQHVELRGIFNELYDLEHPPGYYTADSSIRYYQELAEEMRKVEPAFTIKVIYTALRFQSVEEINKKLIEAFELRKRYPDIITGFDLVAEEDAGHSTLHFLDNWLGLDSLQQVYGVDMPLYLHDGESNWVSVENLYDAVLLNSKRIGHGFNLFRFPHLIEEVKNRDICLEINPISNQVLGFIRDLRLHPGSTYLSRGVPCVISSDDPLIFDYKGLTYDFWEVFLAWELDLKDLKKLTLNSLIYSGLSENEQAAALDQFQRKWQAFITEALNEFPN